MKRPHWLKLSPPVLVGLLVVLGSFVYGVAVIPQRQTASLTEDALGQKLKGYDPSAKLDAGAIVALKDLATIEKGRLDTENAFRTSLIQAVGGTVLLVGLYFTYQNLRATQRNVEIAEDKQVTERFSKAVDMLSSESLHTRLGGIYALERIAKDSDDDYWQVMEVLTAFVRSESPWPPKPKKPESDGTTGIEVKIPVSVEAPQPEEALPVVEGEPDRRAGLPLTLSEWRQRVQERQAFLATLPPLRTDIQAVMTVIGRRKYRYEDGETQQLDLRGTDLRKLQAQKANLTGVVLTGACLDKAVLEKANLAKANLSGARLEGAELEEARLEGAYLWETHLEGANLTEAHLEETYLWEAHLEGVDLYGAHLEGANLSRAHLEGAVLSGAHLAKADLSGANLEGASLWGVDLSQVRSLPQAQLHLAKIGVDTELPPDLHRPNQ